MVTRRFEALPEMVVGDCPKPVRRAGTSLIRMHSATIDQYSKTMRAGGFSRVQAPAGVARQSRLGAGAGFSGYVKFVVLS
ncbi:hypothetical protein [Nonomuraea sp. CA-141351]|uniref:hypothetical protein n=1 Tax=Nonomuraea sp. CA-141351 TaxID=3239996 RepID=UPI003D8E8586